MYSESNYITHWNRWNKTSSGNVIFNDLERLRSKYYPFVIKIRDLPYIFRKKLHYLD
jgi:hypothetical protein